MSSALSTNPVHADPRLRVVLHTNIYIAAFNHLRGRNAQLWSACQIAPALRDCQRNRQNSIVSVRPTASESVRRPEA